jgi:hypothetical protein
LAAPPTNGSYRTSGESFAANDARNGRTSYSRDALLIRVTKDRHIFLQKFFVEPDEAVTLLVFGVLAGITFFILFQGTLL